MVGLEGSRALTSSAPRKRAPRRRSQPASLADSGLTVRRGRVERGVPVGLAGRATAGQLRCNREVTEHGYPGDMGQARSRPAAVVDVAAVHAQVGRWTGHVDCRLTRDVLWPRSFLAVAHVDLLDIANQTQGGAGMRDAQRDNPLVRVSDHSQADKRW